MLYRLEEWQGEGLITWDKMVALSKYVIQHSEKVPERPPRSSAPCGAGEPPLWPDEAEELEKAGSDTSTGFYPSDSSGGNLVVGRKYMSEAGEVRHC